MSPERPSNTAPSRPTLAGLAEALATARREFGRDLPLKTLRVFIDIALHPGTHMTATAERLGLGKSSTSRSISALTARSRLGRDGPRLVEATEDPDEGRIRRLRLTARGEAVARRLVGVKG